MPVPPLTAAQTNAWASIQAQLQVYGLSSLISWARDEIVAGVPPEQFQLDLRQQKAFKDRFWIVDELRRQNRPPMSIDQILEYEDQWVGIASAGGLPNSFNTREYAQKAIAGGNSIGEMADRVNKGYVQVNNYPSVQAAFREFFPHDGLLAAIFIDDKITEPELEQMVTSAQIAAEGRQLGFAIDRTTATRLAGLGVTTQMADTAFDTLDKSRGLFTETISEQRDLAAEQEGLNAALGLDATSTRAVTRRAQERQAAYAGSDEAATEREGVVGLGRQTPH